MAYVTAEARQQLLDDLAIAIDELGTALAALGAAYELLDERQRRPARGRALPAASRPPTAARSARTRRSPRATRCRAARSRSRPPACRRRACRSFLERAVEAVDEADDALVELQDSMLPVEVGDRELRAGLAEVRTLVEALRARARVRAQFGRCARDE